MIFDSHSHYDDEAFDNDRDELLNSLCDKGVEKIISCASSWDSLNKVTDICHRFSFAYPALGIHPENATDLTPERRPVLEALIEKNILLQLEKSVSIIIMTNPRESFRRKSLYIIWNLPGSLTSLSSFTQEIQRRTLTNSLRPITLTKKESFIVFHLPMKWLSNTSKWAII